MEHSLKLHKIVHVLQAQVLLFKTCERPSPWYRIPWLGRNVLTYSSSSSSSPSPPEAFFDAAFMFFRFTLPGRPPPSGLERAKSTCFWLSTRTMNDGTSTICLPTLLNERGLQRSATKSNTTTRQSQRRPYLQHICELA
jgi:hypothetical protein